MVVNRFFSLFKKTEVKLSAVFSLCMSGAGAGKKTENKRGGCLQKKTVFSGKRLTFWKCTIFPVVKW
jgi:hypothetical protein